MYNILLTFCEGKHNQNTRKCSSDRTIPYATTRDINDSFFVYCLHFFTFLIFSGNFMLTNCHTNTHSRNLNSFFLHIEIKMFFQIITQISMEISEKKNSIILFFLLFSLSLVNKNLLIVSASFFNFFNFLYLPEHNGYCLLRFTRF